jgi:D-3-phosphoglycerate dehydrogenase
LELIVRAGVGYDNIDTTTAREQNVKVENVPGKNVHAVAELVIGFMFYEDRKIHLNNESSKNNQWNKAKFGSGKGLRDRTLGIVGLGKIGINVAKPALAMGMKVIFASIDHKIGQKLYPLGNSNGLYSCECVSLTDVFKQSDVITFHVPMTKGTKNMIRKETLSMMKKNVLLINTARGGIVNEDDLMEHLNSNPQFRYACDVFQGEPSYKKGKLDKALLRHKNVISTHHIGAGTKQASFAVGTGLYNQLELFVLRNKIVNCVNFLSPKL